MCNTNRRRTRTPVLQFATHEMDDKTKIIDIGNPWKKINETISRNSGHTQI
jgi:hypothetical protein